MPSLSADILAYFQQLPWLELIAMLLSLAYVILAAKSSIWCWPAAFISTTLYTFIFFDVMLLMDSALNAYYLLMAVYGYWQWSKPTSNKKVATNEVPIVSWNINVHVKVCFALTVIAFALGYLVDNFTPADFPYLDTFTTVFAVFATYLVTQKILENWLYWVVIDFVSIYLYIEKGLIPTTVLFIIFVIISVYGFITWSRQYKSSIDEMNVSSTS